MCNLERWYRGTYFQGRNTDTDERMTMWTWGRGREGWGEFGEIGSIYIFTTVCKIATSIAGKLTV